MILRDNPHVLLGVKPDDGFEMDGYDMAVEIAIKNDIQRLKILGRQFLNEDIEV